MNLFYHIVLTVLMYCVLAVLQSRNSYFFVPEIEIYALDDTTVAKLTLHNLMLLTILIPSVPTSERETAFAVKKSS